MSVRETMFTVKLFTIVKNNTSLHCHADTQNVTHSYSGIVLSLKKEGDYDMWNIMDSPEDVTGSEISQPQNDKYWLPHSYTVPVSINRSD